MFNEPPTRKRMRLPAHDYARGAYFVTICAIGGHEILGKIRNAQSVPSTIGGIVDEEWRRLHSIKGITLDEHVIMPNHMHGIIVIERGCGRTLPSLMQLFKSRAVKSLQANYHDPECRIWQRGYHEDILNGHEHLNAVRRYIRNNPANW